MINYIPKTKRAEQVLHTLINNKVKEFHYKSRVALYNDVKRKAIASNYYGLIFNIPFRTIVPFLEKELKENELKQYFKKEVIL